jgi:hypothetical protein
MSLAGFLLVTVFKRGSHGALSGTNGDGTGWVPYTNKPTLIYTLNHLHHDFHYNSFRVSVCASIIPTKTQQQRGEKLFITNNSEVYNS